MIKKLSLLTLTFILLTGIDCFGRLRVGIYENRPMVFTDKTGTPRGIFIDLFEEIAKRENLEYTYVRNSWKDNISKIKSNKIDILLAAGFSKKREQNMSFTNETIFINWAAIFSNQRNSIESFPDLQNKRIAVLSNDIYIPPLMKKINDFNVNASIIKTDTYTDIFRLLRDKKADAGVVNRVFGMLHQHEYRLKKTPLIFFPVEIKIAFSKNINPSFIKRVDFIINSMKNNKYSILNKSIDRYIKDTPVIKESRFIAYILTTCLFLFAFISFLLVQLYKKRAEIKTLEIENQNRELEKKIKEKNQIQKELLKSKERLKELSDAILEVFWVYDSVNNKLEFVSTAFETVWKRSIKELLESDNLWIKTVFHEDRDKIKKAHKKLLKEKVNLEREYRIVRPDNEIRWIYEKCYIIQNMAGEVEKIVGTSMDITQKKIFEDQLSQSQKMQAIGTMAGGIAHDFNNILGIIIGNAELAMEYLEKSSPAVKNIKQIESASVRAKEIVKQILAFTRKSKMEKVVIDAGEIILETLSLLRATIPSNIIIETAIDKKRHYIKAAPSQINQIVMNLCTNAAFALKSQKSGRIELITESFEINEANMIFYDLKPGGYLRFFVKDDGEGMKKEVIKRIFDPYFTTKCVGEGSGLGLSVVLGIVKDIKGDIIVSSSKRKGTEFQIFIPLEKKNKLEKEIKSLNEINGSENILFVDDEESLALLGKKILEASGFNVEQKSDPSKAFEVFLKNPYKYDLIITDMTMPEMTGLELAKKIKDIKPEIPVILCTGYSDQDLGKRDNFTLIDTLMYKPLRGNELRTKVRSVIDNSKKGLLN